MSDVVSTTGSAASFDVLRKRVERLISGEENRKNELQLELKLVGRGGGEKPRPGGSLKDFLDFISSVSLDGDAYLFGGLVRDLAIFGRRGFNSDIDIVVDGDFSAVQGMLERLKARRNKFGGYRLYIEGWPVDVWRASDTWAIKNGFVRYDGVGSLTKTTVLNWDAILMGWRAKRFICSPAYLDDLSERAMDVVLEENPNPLGMAVRVFRHLCQKEARRIGVSAYSYLERATSAYAFEDLRRAELRSYGATLIEPALFDFFATSRGERGEERERYARAVGRFEREGRGVAWGQLKFDLK